MLPGITQVTTPLHHAAWRGEADQLEQNFREDYLNCVNSDGRTALDDARLKLDEAQRGHADARKVENFNRIVRFLELKGGRTAKEVLEGRVTPLHHAAWRGDASAVEQVYQDEDLDCVNSDNRTALDDARLKFEEAQRNQAGAGIIANYRRIISFLEAKGGRTAQEVKAGRTKQIYEVSLRGQTITLAPFPNQGVRQGGQEIDGFGASLTHSSAFLLQSLPEHKRREILLDLFDRVNGIGLSYLRLPMGTSDFRPHEDYTYADLPPEKTRSEQYSSQKDRSLNDLHFFSIDKDRAYLLPILREILNIAPHIKIMGSPWSAPEWMKVPSNDDLRPEMYEVYALYFVKFVKAYAAERIRIDAVTLQNEPQHDTRYKGYHGMLMSEEDHKRFAKILGRAFKENKIDTKIVIFDHNWKDVKYPEKVLDDPEASSYIDGVAFHGYGGEIVENQTVLHDQFPDKNIYFTECGGSAGSSFEGDLQWDMTHLVIGATTHWAKCVLKWNLALDEQCGPKIRGGHENARGVVTCHQGNYRRNEEYYALGHASRFVRPGAKRIIQPPDSKIQGLDYVIFENRDRSIVFVFYNNSNQNKSITIDLRIWRIPSSGFEIRRNSASTLVFQQNSAPRQYTTQSRQTSSLV